MKENAVGQLFEPQKRVYSPRHIGTAASFNQSIGNLECRICIHMWYVIVEILSEAANSYQHKNKKRNIKVL